MKKLIVGNWKLNLNHLEAIQLLQKINYSLPEKIYDEIDIVISPSHSSLRSVQTVIDIDQLSIQSSAQDVSQYGNGAYTGEVSSLQLSQLNIKWCIVGHSERRIHFSETNQIVNTKLKNLLKNNIKPIVCIGESEDERISQKHLQTCLVQVKEIFKGIRKDSVGDIAIAYEPVWAIGTGQVAKPEDAEEILGAVRSFIEQNSFNIENFRFLYGGSVNAGNAKELINTQNIDGFLVGGSSLDSEEYVNIIKLSV
jgi:triosephosphate isomerase